LVATECAGLDAPLHLHHVNSVKQAALESGSRSGSTDGTAPEQEPEAVGMKPAARIATVAFGVVVMGVDQMKAMLTVVTCLLIAAGARAGDVYVVTDSKGNRVYTDRPQSLPAEKITVRGTETNSEDATRAQSRVAGYAAEDAALGQQQEQTEAAAKAKLETAEDRAKRCVDARDRYQSMMNARRLYEEGPDGERRYLSSEEIDASRADAKQMMDMFCEGQ
jgi:hypothetical protein